MFTDQKPFVVTKPFLTNVTRDKRRFGCALCSHVFQVGDTVRWVHADGGNGLNCGNFYVCPEHDTTDVLDQAKISFDNAVALAKQWEIYGPDWVK